MPLTRRFSHDCSGAVYDGELKFDMVDPPFKPDIIFPERGQVRSLTYDAISKYPYDHKMLQVCNASNDMKTFTGRLNLQKVTRSPRILIFSLSRIFKAGHLSSEVMSVT